ncbi:MAG: SAVED domain-containing protein [Candidatus Pacebacteria bacterium]|nr:SAVED domain-containing protein [Candidatus Paceibacterota bacterium]
MSLILKEHSGLSEINLFAACPAPIAIHCGREIMPKIDPRVIVHDYNRTAGGWLEVLKIN